jgi:hypothetical protein
MYNDFKSLTDRYHIEISVIPRILSNTLSFRTAVTPVQINHQILKRKIISRLNLTAFFNVLFTLENAIFSVFRFPQSFLDYFSERSSTMRSPFQINILLHHQFHIHCLSHFNSFLKLEVPNTEIPAFLRKFCVRSQSHKKTALL